MVLRRLAALTIAATILATACSGPIRRSHVNSSPSPSPEALASPSPSHAGVAWTDCGNGFQCATIDVPLDYANPDNGTISIAIIRKPAKDRASRIGSLLTNPGGPGASGIDFVRGTSSLFATLNQRFDIVGFDPRGVGKSSPVRCLDGAHEDAYDALDSVLDDPQEKQAAIDADKAYAAGCEEKSGKALPFVDTISAARDMDAIRAAVGDAQLSYMGLSYGTFLGETYAHLFPDHIRALVLDGVVDPAVSANDLVLGQLVSFEQNLQAFNADCQAKSTCQWGRSGDPNTKLDALMNKLDANPMQVGNRQLTRGLAITGVIRALYSQGDWPALDAGLTAAARGDGSLLLLYADDYNGRNSDGTYDNQSDANSAINCLDRPVPKDIAYYDGLGPQYAKASPHFGPATQYANLLCAYWPVPATGRVGPISADSAPPILLVGGTGDPATPYQWAKNVHQQLASSVLLTRNGQGHVSYGKSQCIAAIVNAYLFDLTVPADGMTCN